MELSDTGPPSLPGPAEGAVTPLPAGTASCFVCHLCLPCLGPGRLSLSPLRLCLCSASFLDCRVPVSCLRLAVSLGLSLMTPPLGSCPEYPLRSFSTCSGPDVVLMQTRVPASTRSLVGRRLQQVALQAPKAPDPALGRSRSLSPRSAPAGGTCLLAGASRCGGQSWARAGSPPRRGASARMPRALCGRDPRRLGWAAGSACSAGAGPRGRVRRQPALSRAES